MKIIEIILLVTVILTLLCGALFYEGDIPQDVVDARYANQASQFLDLDQHGRIHYRDEGNRRNPAIVLLHGSNASLHAFEPWVSELINDYRLVSIDLPGHGLTGAVASGVYSGESYIDVVTAIVAELELDQFVLAGNSMGGGVAWRYALQHPQQLRGLVLIDAGGPAEWYEDDDGSNAVAIFSLLRQGWFRAIADKLDPYYLIVQGLEASFVDHSVITDQMIQRYYDLNLREGTRGATIARFGQSWAAAGEDLSQIETPTLIMWGKQDNLIAFDQAARFEAAIPNTVTAYYDEVGHLPMEEIPRVSARDLAAFMESL